MRIILIAAGTLAALTVVATACGDAYVGGDGVGRAQGVEGVGHGLGAGGGGDEADHLADVSLGSAG